MKTLAAFALLFAASPVLANPFPNGNAQTGQKLFDQYKCNRCHERLMNGDGNAIFTRPDRTVKDRAGLVEQMHMCTGNLGITLTPQDEQHLGAHLNRYYNLK